MNSLKTERSIFVFENNYIPVDPQTESTQFLKIWTTIILFIHIHLNKLVFILMVVLIMNKVSSIYI